MKPQKQIDFKRYMESSYNSFERFVSYACQLQAIESCKPKTILEIGPGNSIVTQHLRTAGYHVTTVDVDPESGSDLVADIRDLPSKDATFDVVVAFQVLEHIPWEDVSGALVELARVSKKNLVISVPQRVTCFECVLKIPFMRTLIKRNFIDLSICIPLKFPKGISKQHHWELDFWQYSRKTFRNILGKVGVVVSEFSPALDKYHRFFVIEKK